MEIVIISISFPEKPNNVIIIIKVYMVENLNSTHYTTYIYV